jgi:hypothetical protein
VEEPLATYLHDHLAGSTFAVDLVESPPLALGILGKLALWRALLVVAKNDTRLNGMELEQLVARAQQQHAQVEQWRLLVARSAFVIN